MTSIINPWIFYLINVVNNVKFLFLLIIIIVSAVITSLFIIAACDECDNSYLKQAKKAGIVLFISMTALTLVPDKETLYQMLIAHYVTPNNIETVIDGTKDIVDYIIEGANEIAEQE